MQTAIVHLNALSPVTAWPRMSECTSCVPSYVYTLSRFAMCRMPRTRRECRSRRAGAAPRGRCPWRCYVVPLGQRHLLRRERAGVLQAAEVQRHELRLHDLGEHVGEAHLLNLESADRPVEHHALLRVLERFLEARHRRADRAPRDAVARLRETHQRTLEAARLRQDRVGRQVHVLKHELARVARAQRELALLVLGLEALAVRRHDEAANRLVAPSPFVFAHTTAICAVDPLVIHILVPFSIHVPSFCSLAIVIMPDGFEP